MSRLAEYGSYTDAERAKLTLLAEAFSPKVRTDVSLVHSTAGYEPAGSMARHTGEYWAVRWYMGAAIMGARYLREHEARAHFDRLMVGSNSQA